MRIIFMATPDFAVPVLKRLHESDEHEVVAVITQPDKARGRHGTPVPTPVKEYAVSNGIDVYTPMKIRDAEFVDILRGIDCDVMVVFAFGQILSSDILHMKKYGCINIHTSLLPAWRGAAPMQWAIMEGNEYSGVTIMQMDEGIDTGDILMSERVELAPDETTQSLTDRLTQIGCDLILQVLDSAAKGMLAPVKQDDEKSSYAKILSKEMGKVDFSQSAVQIERKIRALSEWPGVYCSHGGKTVKLHKAEVVSGNSTYSPGVVSEVTKKAFLIQTGDGQLRIRSLQPEGKKIMDAASFLNGNPLVTGESSFE
ncbi:MAG: methionyl-tRNA formyltransferase [Eubacterium sp.]|nr:methionyl-tRNA formyltransferase [Eubacterium sp.]